ncbi:MAG TPA: CdaR family protein [Bryobacteraceae bacterium]|nr:CdaR family protein [Bryobacteraceae bacterium]
MRLITRNFGWKLGSLTLAVLLWFAILGEPELVTTHTAPILYKSLPPGLLIGSDALDQVRVELRGPSGKLSQDRLSEMAVLLDLADVRGPGERTFTLSDADFHLPQGVTFLRSVPSQLRVRFARMVSREVPVNVRIYAPPPSGYHVVHQETVPVTLRIAGPEGRVASVSSAETDAIDLSGVTANREIKVNAFVSDPQVRFEISPVVTVRLTVEKNQ